MRHRRSFDDHFNTKSVMVATGDGPFDWYRDTAGAEATELEQSDRQQIPHRGTALIDMETNRRDDDADISKSGGRLDRLPIEPFHYRIMTLIGIGMFFDGFDIYIAGTVLGVTLKSGFSTLAENALFISGDVLRNDARLVRHRLSRRSLRPSVLLPVQSAAVRRGIACGGIRTEHDPS